MADFFISYTQADRPWAEWIAWTLEEGFSATIQAWTSGNAGFPRERGVAGDALSLWTKGEPMGTKTLDQHIETTPGTMGGKPRISGRRITVQDIVIWHERMAQSADEIAAEHDLDIADVYAALAYYFDHREAIDAAMLEGHAFVENLRKETPSKLWRKLQDRGLHGWQD